MFFTYVYRELRRRHRQALLTALGLAVGVGLVVAVTAYAGGVGRAQDEVLHSLYGVGTDITVSQTAKLDQGEGGPARIGMTPPDQDRQGQKFSRDDVRSAPGQDSISAKKLATLSALDGVGQVAGGLVLNATHVEGTFAEASSQGGAQGTAGGDAGQTQSSQPLPSASMAPIKITSFSLTGVDVAQTSLGPLSATELVSGRSFTADEAKARVAVVDKAYAKQQSLAVGDTIRISGDTYEVVGIVTASGGTTSASNAYIPLARAQAMSDNGGKVNQIYVKADDATRIAAVKKQIKSVLPDATVTTAQDLADQVSGSLSSASSLADRLGTWLAVAALVASFAVASLLTVSAVSRRVREFGTLKALGWRSRRVVGQVLGESFVTGVVGGVLGVALGVGAARLIAHFSPALKATVASATSGAGPGGMPGGAPGMGPALDSAAQSVSVYLTAPVSVQLVALAVGLALAGGLLAGAFGGWRAARLRPADALRRVD
jgi:ABC-type antimicrobial peptide transport system permease subunit